MRRRVREAPPPTVWTPASFDGREGPLLLDTHVWLWRMNDDHSRTAAGTQALLSRVGATSTLLVSDISFWEVAVKVAKGKLQLTVMPEDWLRRVEQAPGIRFQPLTREILLRSTQLAGTPHNDPADRMLMATAQLLGIPLVTADRQIISYAKTRARLQVIDVRR